MMPDGDPDDPRLIGDGRIYLHNDHDAEFCRWWDEFRAVADAAKLRIREAWEREGSWPPKRPPPKEVIEAARSGRY